MAAPLLGARLERPDVTTIAAAAEQPARVAILVIMPRLWLSCIVLRFTHG